MSVSKTIETELSQLGLQMQTQLRSALAALDGDGPALEQLTPISQAYGELLARVRTLARQNPQAVRQTVTLQQATALEAEFIAKAEQRQAALGAEWQRVVQRIALVDQYESELTDGTSDQSAEPAAPASPARPDTLDLQG